MSVSSLKAQFLLVVEHSVFDFLRDRRLGEIIARSLALLAPKPVIGLALQATLFTCRGAQNAPLHIDCQFGNVLAAGPLPPPAKAGDVRRERIR